LHALPGKEKKNRSPVKWQHRQTKASDLVHQDYIPDRRSFTDGDVRVSKTKNAIKLANYKRDAAFARRLDELLKWVVD
jgi:hypothetical protein